MYENVIRSVDEFIRYAVNEAFYLRDDSIKTEHILLGFMKINSRETESLVKAGVNYNELKSYIIENRGFGEFNNVANKLSKNAKRVVDSAMNIAMETENIQVLPCHLLIALLENKDCFAVKILKDIGIDINVILADIKGKIDMSTNESR